MKRINPLKESKENEFKENLDYYFEKGLMVLTEHFLKKRGYCCKNNCRHCPYSDNDGSEPNFSTALKSIT